MLMLLTLSFLQSGLRNMSESDLASRVYNVALDTSGSKLKEKLVSTPNTTLGLSSEAITDSYGETQDPRLSHTFSSTRELEYISSHNKLQHKNHKGVVHIRRLARDRSSQSHSVETTLAPDNIPQKLDIYYNTPLPVRLVNNVPGRTHATIKIFGRNEMLPGSPRTRWVHIERLLSAPVSTRWNIKPITQAVDIAQRDNIYYNTPPSVRLVHNPPISEVLKQKIAIPRAPASFNIPSGNDINYKSLPKVRLAHNEPKSKAHQQTKIKTEKTVAVSNNLRGNDIYYNTPAPVRLLHNLPTSIHKKKKAKTERNTVQMNILREDDVHQNRTPPVRLVHDVPVPQVHQRKKAKKLSVRTALPVHIVSQNDVHHSTPSPVRLVYNVPVPEVHQRKKAKNLAVRTALPVHIGNQNDVYYNTPAEVFGIHSVTVLNNKGLPDLNVSRNLFEKVIANILRSKNILESDPQFHKIHKDKKLPRLFKNKTKTKLPPVTPSQNDDVYYNTPAPIRLIHNMSGTKKDSTLKTTLHIVPTSINNGTLNTSKKVQIISRAQLKAVDKPTLNTEKIVPEYIPTGKDKEPKTAEPSRVASSTQQSTKPSAYTRTTSTIRHILHSSVSTQKPTREPYLDVYIKHIEERNTGYLSEAFEQLCENIALLSPEYVADIVRHTDAVVTHYQKSGRLNWLEGPMTSILQDVSQIITEEPIDELQTRATILKTLIQDRRKIMGVDFNELMDYADDLIIEEDGLNMLRAVHQVKLFPITNETGIHLCKSIIKAFGTPFSHLTGTKDLQYLIKNATKIFVHRFPEYRRVKNAELYILDDSIDTSNNKENFKKDYFNKISRL